MKKMLKNELKSRKKRGKKIKRNEMRDSHLGLKIWKGNSCRK